MRRLVPVPKWFDEFLYGVTAYSPRRVQPAPYFNPFDAECRPVLMKFQWENVWNQAYPQVDRTAPSKTPNVPAGKYLHSISHSPY